MVFRYLQYSRNAVTSFTAEAYFCQEKKRKRVLEAIFNQNNGGFYLSCEGNTKNPIPLLLIHSRIPILVYSLFVVIMSTV